MEKEKSTNEIFDELYHQYTYMLISVNALQYALDSTKDEDDNFLEIRAFKDFLFRTIGSLNTVIQNIKTLDREKLDELSSNKATDANFTLCEITSDSLQLIRLFSEGLNNTEENKKYISSVRARILNIIKKDNNNG